MRPIAAQSCVLLQRKVTQLGASRNMVLCRSIWLPTRSLFAAGAAEPLTCLRGWRPAQAAALHGSALASEHGMCTAMCDRPVAKFPAWQPASRSRPASTGSDMQQARQAGTAASPASTSALASPAVQARLRTMQARHAELCAELSSALLRLMRPCPCCTPAALLCTFACRQPTTQ